MHIQLHKTQPQSAEDINFSLAKTVEALRLSRVRARSITQKSQYSRDLPNPEITSRVLKDLFAALFPRHGGGQDGTDEGIDYFVGSTLNTAIRQLKGLLSQELRFSYSSEEKDFSEIQKVIPKILCEFADGLPEIREHILLDARAAYDGDPSAQSIEEILLSYPGIKAVFYHRVAHSLYQLGVPIVARIISEIAHSITGIDIHPGAKIGRSFFIDHGTGVVIGETTIIGNRVRLYQAVTLGAKSFSIDDNGALIKGQPRHPIIEDDVVIYAGATILGRVTIGKGSVIGGNVWLTQSVPPNSHIVQAQATSQSFVSGLGI
ncbi:MAG: serine O-acetyltransferase EpsC [Hyphomicrobium sp.]